jgi:hypothetical protein
MGPNYENSTVVAKGCYWNKRPFSNENEIHTNRPCQTLTYTQIMRRIPPDLRWSPGSRRAPFLTLVA